VAWSLDSHPDGYRQQHAGGQEPLSEVVQDTPDHSFSLLHTGHIQSPSLS